eukprot:CFRG1167T1
MNEHYEYVVIGTGLEECILAAALARVGKSVLHVDKNDYYGSEWATTNLAGIQDFVQRTTSISSTLRPKTIPEAQELKNNTHTDVFSGVSSGFSSAEDSFRSKGVCDESISEQLIAVGRRFCIDLMPKLLLSNGKLVELLISSKVGDYLEFRPLEATCIFSDGIIQQVPCTKADVFKTKTVSPVEKRFLMRFLKTSMDTSTHAKVIEEYGERPYCEFLSDNKLSSRLQTFILYAIAKTEDSSVLTGEGLKRTTEFMESLGKFGNTPFLYPTYGIAELAQAFCRTCAVFGGTYMLKKVPYSINTTSESDDGTKQVTGVTFEDGAVTCDNVILGSSYADALAPATEISSQSVSRGIIVSSGPLSVSTDGVAIETTYDTIVTTFPPGVINNQSAINVIQLGPKTSSVPQNYWCYHLTSLSSGSNSAREQFEPFIQKVFQNDLATNVESDVRPIVLYEAYFHYKSSVKSTTPKDSIQNVYIVGGCDTSQHCSASVTKARELFKQICPNDEFLPPPPAPDEIDWDAMTKEPEENTMLEKTMPNNS